MSELWGSGLPLCYLTGFCEFSEPLIHSMGFPCGSADKESVHNAGDLGLIPALGRYPGEGEGYPLQYSGPENSMNCIIHGVAKSWTWLSDFHFTSHFTYPFHLCLWRLPTLSGWCMCTHTVCVCVLCVCVRERERERERKRERENWLTTMGSSLEDPPLSRCPRRWGKECSERGKLHFPSEYF